MYKNMNVFKELEKRFSKEGEHRRLLNETERELFIKIVKR
jgi:hypothetical protein